MKNTLDLEAAKKRLLEKFRDNVCKKYAVEAAKYARENAPWTDRTGDARKMITGKVIDEENEIGFMIMHRKEYGKYLETANSGKYAILKPTIEHFRADFLSAIRQFFGGR